MGRKYYLYNYFDKVVEIIQLEKYVDENLNFQVNHLRFSTFNESLNKLIM